MASNHANSTGWPFDPSGQILLGVLNPQHTSSLSAEYVEGTLPTPWPFLLASTVLSQILGTIGLYSIFKSRNEIEYLAARGQRERSAITGMILTHGAVAISTIRSISAFVASIKTQFKGSGSYAAPSTMLLLMASLHPYLCTYNTTAYLDLVVSLDLITVYVAFLIMAFGPLSSHVFYGRLIVTGGNCPFYTVGGCSTSIRNSWTVVGCGDQSPREGTFSNTANNGDPNSHNYIHESEQVISWFGAVYGLYMVICAISFIVEVYDRVRNRIQGHRYFFKWGKGHDGNVLGLKAGIVTFVLAIGIAAVSIPIHATYEIHPKTLMYVDGFGTSASFVPPLGTTFTGGNETLWSDCFTVVPPHSQNGFWSDWVAGHTGNVARLLALI